MRKLTCAYHGYDSLCSDYLAKVEFLFQETRATLALDDACKKMIHRNKYQEAISGKGVFLELESECTGVPLDVLCETVIEKHKAHEILEARLESARVSTRKRIKDVSSSSQMYVELKAFENELATILDASL